MYITSKFECEKYPQREDGVWAKDNAAYYLVNNVYDLILEKCREPLTEDQWDAQAQYPIDPDTLERRKWKYEDIFRPRSPTPSDDPTPAETETGGTVPVEVESGEPVTIEIGSDVPPEVESDEPAPSEAGSCESDAPPRNDAPIPECPKIDDSLRKAIPMIINGGNILGGGVGSTWSKMELVKVEAERRGIELPTNKKNIRSDWIRRVVYDHEFNDRWQKDPDFRNEVYEEIGYPEPEPELEVVDDDVSIKNEPSPIKIIGDPDGNMLLTKPSPHREIVPDSEKSLLPREDLSAWGIPRKDDYMLRISKGGELSPLDVYTWAITLSPYNPVLWSSRAYLFYQMGYFDLAIGDAYRAQLLCEVVCDPLKRTRQPGLYPRVWDAVERHIIQLGNQHDRPDIITLLRKSTGVPYFLPAVRKTIHHIISLSLLALRCWRDYLVTEQYLTERLTMPDRDVRAIKDPRERLHAIVCERDRTDKRNCDQEYFYERRYGFTRGRLYPYEPDPIQRATETVCERINRDMQDVVEAHGLEKKFEVRSDVLTQQIKACATEEIKWGQIIYVEEPSIRGHLRPEHPPGHCENCKRKVSPDSMYPNDDLPELKCSCLRKQQQPVYWCKPPMEEVESEPRGEKRVNEDGDDRPTKKRKTDKDGNEIPSCLEIGNALYHEKTCGKDWSWLHDAMRPVFDDDELHFMTHTNEQHGTVLSLLLRDTFAITLKRRELQGQPNLLAHEIDELIPLMGAENMEDQYFPFSFAANVRVPFDILSMLGVDIFRDLTFDTWVIQLVLRKLLLNVIPWDHSRRCDVEYGANESYNQMVDVPDDQPRKVRLFNEGNIGRWSNYEANAPTFNDLYIFPGVSMFNHRCRNFFESRKEGHTQHNVMWDWDQTIPNRLILWAWKDIEKGEQICLEYTPYIFDSHTDKRVLGKKCECEYCEKRTPTPPPPPSNSDDDQGDGSSLSPPPPPRPSRRSRGSRLEQTDLDNSSLSYAISPELCVSPMMINTSSSNKPPPYSALTNARDDERFTSPQVINSPQVFNASKEATPEKAPAAVPNLPDYEEVDAILDNLSKVNKSPIKPPEPTPLDISILGQFTGVDTYGAPIAVPGERPPRGRLPSERYSIGNKVYDQYGDTLEVRSQLELDPTPIRKPRKRPSAFRDSDEEDRGSPSGGGDGNQQEGDGEKDEHVAKKQKTATNNFSSILGHWSSDDDPSLQVYKDMSLHTLGNTLEKALEDAQAAIILNNDPKDDADGGGRDEAGQGEEPKGKDMPDAA